MSDTNEKNGVYLNGKNQIIELFKHLEQGHKSKILQHLRSRNPALAKELSETTFSYQNIWELDDESLSQILTHSKPVILGLALSLSHPKQQRRALALLSREKALKAYEIMTKDLSHHRRECIKAQEKVLETAIELSRRKVINFY